MKLSKQALVLGVLVLSTALGLAKGRDVLKTLRGMKDDSTVHHLASEPTSASALMTKMYNIFLSCEGCVETASPSPQVEVTHGGNPSPSKSSPGNEKAPDTPDEVSSHGVSPLCGLNHHPSIESVDVDGYTVDRLGCFQDISNQDTANVSDEEDKMAACVASCSDNKRFFALKTVTEGTWPRYEEITSCKCFTDYPYFFVENPSNRLSEGTCECTGGDDKDKMELYVKTKKEDECPDTSLVKDYRDQLVLEGGKALGFDLVTNEYKQSPFKFTKVGCGTNMYDMKTSSSGSSGSMSTSMTELKEATENSREELTSSVSMEAEAGYDSWWGSVSGKVSGSANQESNKELSASTSQGLNTQKFESFGVKRIASLEMKDISSFVQFNRQFIEMLKKYKDSDYVPLYARQLFDEFGMLQIGAGLIGGYVSLVSTVKMGTLESEFGSTDKMKKCYEAAVAASGEYLGVSGSFSADKSGCEGTEMSNMKKHLDEYSDETQSSSYFGGDSDGEGQFTVPSNLARFLADKKLYPEPEKLNGDPTLRLVFLTDYLDPKKIHPLEFRDWGISEDEFQEVREKLEGVMQEILEEVGAEFDECSDCTGTIYLEPADDGFTCECYNPQPLKYGDPCEFSFDCGTNVCDAKAKVCKVPVLGDCTDRSQCVGNPDNERDIYNVCQVGKCRTALEDPCQSSDECQTCTWCQSPYYGTRCCRPGSNGLACSVTVSRDTVCIQKDGAGGGGSSSHLSLSLF